VIHRTAGGTAFVPRGMPHCFKNCSEQRARVLIALHLEISKVFLTTARH
jgi:hypothetical protein